MYVPKASPILSTSQLERKDILLLLTIINKNDVPNLNIPQIAALIFWRSSSFPRNVRWCLEKNTPIIFSPILRRCYRINLMTMACSTTNTLLNSSMHNFIWAMLKLCKNEFLFITNAKIQSCGITCNILDHVWIDQVLKSFHI